jgi:GTP-binding protein HflX
VAQLDLGFRDFVRELEEEIGRGRGARDTGGGRPRALLVNVGTAARTEAEASLAELAELSLTNDIVVAGTLIQHKAADSRFLLGRGKLRDLSIIALQKSADIVIFDRELNPSQMRSITDQIEMPVIDRTQLILDIFAQRAMTAEGKLQVELAQLRYLLPRLASKNTAMSRLTGGIGARGPGETKLEIDRRRARERVLRLERSLGRVSKNRKVQRARRSESLRQVSIVGYTNAGKSSLLNALTGADVLAESRLFATLDPASRRLEFSGRAEAILTDTVGFISNLPGELIAAFRATLEELESADLLLHVIDASSSRMEKQISAVEDILADLSLDRIPVLRVLNKMDLVLPETMRMLSKRFSGIPVSAINPETLVILRKKIEGIITAS